MPANLTPEYERAERRYREAADDAARLAALQEMLATVPKHKGTEKIQADIKHRLSQLRREQQQQTAHTKGPDPFHIPRSGAGQVVLIGPPNTGKSSLLAATTNAEARVADYPFTTVVPQPGMWVMDDVPIELVDTPPFTAEHMPAGLMGTIHNADVVGVVVEASDNAPEQVEMTLGVLAARGLTLRSAPRNELATAGGAGFRPGLIVMNKADLGGAGGIERQSGNPYPEHGAEKLREPAARMAALQGSAGFQPAGSGGILPPDSHFLADAAALRELYGGNLEVVAVSARTGRGLNDLFGRFWELLAMIRIYPKEPGQPPDRHKPFTLPMGATVADLARVIHRDLPETMKYARLWGHGRFEGQQVHRTEVLRDRDVVEIHE